MFTRIRKKNRKKVIITQEEIDQAVDEYLENGGKITKVDIKDCPMTDFPVGYSAADFFLRRGGFDA